MLNHHYLPSGFSISNPELSEDGGKLVFTSPTEPEPGFSPEGNAEIYLYDVQSQGFAQVTSPAYTGPRHSRQFVTSNDSLTTIFKSRSDQEPGQNFDTSEELFLSTCRPTWLALGDGGRFNVEVEWNTRSRSGQGVAVPQTDDTGQFWFFDAAL